jgi:hypothetical protein
LIYDGPISHESRHKLKLMNQTVNVMSPATPKYLRWSKSPITFNRMDHSNNIPKPGRFPLIVDPLVRTTRLTKALVDGGSALKLIYLDTFERLGLIGTNSKITHTHSMKWSRARSPSPSGKLLCLSPSKTQATTTPKHSLSMWSTFSGPITSSWGGHATSSSWTSPAKPTSISTY